MRSLSLKKKVLLGYLLPTGIAVATSVVVYRTLLVGLATSEQVNRTSAVIAYANVAIRSVVEAEAGARGFAGQGDERMLQRYHDALKTYDKTARRLGELVRGRSDQVARVEQGKGLVARWVEEVAAPVIAARRMAPAGLARAANRQLVTVLELRAIESVGWRDPSAIAWREKLVALRSELEATLRLMPSDLVRWMRLGVLVNEYEAAVARRVEGEARARGREAEMLASLLARAAEKEEQVIVAALGDREKRAGLDPFRAVMGEFVEKENESLDHHRRANEAAVRAGKTAAIAGPGLAAALALVLGIALALGIVRSVRSVATAAQALLSGDSDKRAQADANDEIGVMARTFNLMADGLSARNREVTLLSQFGGLLAACTTLDEAYSVIGRLCRQLLSRNVGALYVVTEGRKSVERVAAWGPGGEALAPGFAPEDCWAVRRGQTHVAAGTTDEMRCAHAGLADGEGTGTACIPIMAQGELLSVLSVRLSVRPSASPASDELRIATAAAEPIALALANLRLRERLQNQSIRDPLTGLFNRRFLQETFAKELSSARRHKRPLGVMVLDVDHFKRFNDTFGHAAGDTLLAAVGQLLASNFRNEDIVCRYGGEEFVVVLPYAGLEDTVRRAEELRQSVARLKLQHQGTPLGPVTASLGVSAFPIHGRDEGALIAAADAALYDAKHGGRNRVVVAPTPDIPASEGAARTG